MDNQIAQKKLEIKEAELVGNAEKQVLLEDELKQLEDARADMVAEEAAAREEIANGYLEIENARKEIADGRKEIKKNRSAHEASVQPDNRMLLIKLTAGQRG